MQIEPTGYHSTMPSMKIGQEETSVFNRWTKHSFLYSSHYVQLKALEIIHKTEDWTVERR
jgi:hypothetical protein